MPSSHLILGHPLLLLPPTAPSIRVFSNESTLHMRWPKYWSFSFSIIPFKEHPGLISFRMNWLDLLAVQGTLKSLLQHHSPKASILRCSAFFTVQLSNPYMTRTPHTSAERLGPTISSACSGSHAVLLDGFVRKTAAQEMEVWNLPEPHLSSLLSPLLPDGTTPFSAPPKGLGPEHTWELGGGYNTVPLWTADPRWSSVGRKGLRVGRSPQTITSQSAR